eukprot:GHUV01011924.1.p2 GENE.GHUV01011924.1~~GHUV01011924.1.p2  ORF type:complete len:186 (+),score=50.24 GHUV01011924.1:903-1460(+)
MPSSLERASGDGSSEEGPALDAKPPNGSSSKRGHASRGSGSSSGSGRHNKGGGSKGNLGKGGVSKVTKRPRQSKGASDDKSQLGRLICEGCNGLVLHGTFKGQPAVYKLFGPDRGGIAAGMNEASIYGESQIFYWLLSVLLLLGLYAWLCLGRLKKTSQVTESFVISVINCLADPAALDSGLDTQ